MKNEKCGIYLIACATSGKSYVGSSCRIYTRWSEDRRILRRGKSNCLGLQRAWNKYGESSFSFSTIEECDRADLESREQHFIDTLKPAYNMVRKVKERIDVEQRAKITAAIRARAALITHCPRGHAYDEANTYINKKSKRICRTCNALRVASIYASETPGEREERRKRVTDYQNREREKFRTDARAYAAVHRAEKREYDRQRRLRLAAEAGSGAAS